MIPFFGHRRIAQNRDVIERLNAAVVGAVRSPAFYLAGGVPDTFNGRFEVLVLHTALVVRRLRAAPEPAPVMAQALVDLVFRNLDPALRELGVGDMGVPKRMKRLVEAYTGRAVAYDAALTADDPLALEAALARNVHGGDHPAVAVLAAYVRAADGAVAATPFADLTRGTLAFPDPAVFIGEEPR